MAIRVLLLFRSRADAHIFKLIALGLRGPVFGAQGVRRRGDKERRQCDYDRNPGGSVHATSLLAGHFSIQ